MDQSTSVTLNFWTLIRAKTDGRLSQRCCDMFDVLEAKQVQQETHEMGFSERRTAELDVSGFALLRFGGNQGYQGTDELQPPFSLTHFSVCSSSSVRSVELIHSGHNNVLRDSPEIRLAEGVTWDYFPTPPLVGGFSVLLNRCCKG